MFTRFLKSYILPFRTEISISITFKIKIKTEEIKRNKKFKKILNLSMNNLHERKKKHFVYSLCCCIASHHPSVAHAI